MNGRVIAGAVLVLVVVVGSILLVVGSMNGGDSDKGSSACPAESVTVVACAARLGS